jgi:hypothetical protein
MFDLRIKSPSQVIEHLTFQSATASDDPELQSMEERERISRWEELRTLLMAHLARYLRGVGHVPPPSDPGESDQLNAEMREAEVKNAIYRAERFLALSTGCEILPVDPNWQVEVRLSSVDTVSGH